jgi:acylphosphatase
VSDTVGRRIVVQGAVQGVGYRAFARRAALRLGIPGSARNLPDGTVEVLVAGPRALLSVFVAELRQGPPHGWVTGVIEEEVSPEVVGNNGFVIK